jgi:hypothetical protein
LVAGILWTFLVSFFWFPETSSHMAFQQLLAMMQHLQGQGNHTWALLQQQQDLLLAEQQQTANSVQFPSPQQQGAAAGQLSSTHAEQNSCRTTQLVEQSCSNVSTEISTATTSAQTAPAMFPAPAADAECLVPSSHVSLPMHNLSGIIHRSRQPMAGTEAVKRGGGLARQQEEEQQKTLEQRLQRREDDACDEDVKNFFAARARLQDSLKAAAAEHHLGWLCGRPLILPSVLLPCNLSCGCRCLWPKIHATKATTACTFTRSDRTHEGGTTGSEQQGSASRGRIEQGGEGRGLPPFLPDRQVRAVAIAQRHCSHVLWVLHKLLQDRFDQDALLTVNSW